ncbi:MAG: methyl-accepting chemotaxis protein [Pseudomonadales bacterium]|nr:methyl-accepting chemotaxis protein [Pseudomonadales bacterium]
MKAKKGGAASASNVGSVFVLGALIVSVGLIVANLFIMGQGSQQDQKYLQLASDIRVQTFRAITQARDATSGQAAAFSGLESTMEAMTDISNALSGKSSKLVAEMPAELKNYDEIWGRVKANADSIVQRKEQIIFLHDVAKRLNQTIPELQQEYDNVVEILLENEAPADQVAQARSQSWRAERIARNVDKMLAGGADAKQAADQFNYDASLFGTVLKGMREGNKAMRISRVTDKDALDSLGEVTELFKFVSESVDDIFKATPDLFEARQATNALLDDQAVLLEALTKVTQKIESLPATRTFNTTTLSIFAALALGFVVLWGVMRLQDTRKDLKAKEDENKNNQDAIMRLLDELADLADGDLTTTATVTEDFTGAIADSINFTIDQLRILVSQINDTAVKVSTAAQDTQSTALHLAEASEHQAQEIAGASAAVNEMAVTIDQVSANAAESAAVAERSVSIASKGAEVVQNTIQGMDNIREQIQETSKRIKRLGESSQEIGDIVSLINDIADQTNILALNAAIQASMAGEAGRGFAVVADEVQRLAERSSAATKQIEALVKTIQTDTNEAVASMEQTTTEVVRGARLAQDAGVALEEIENVSTNLAELIQNISNAARQQASSAGHISNTMNVIQEITSQTSSGTNATAQSIGHLAEMAIDLRNSVAGFKLPEEAGDSDDGMSDGFGLPDADQSPYGDDEEQVTL